MVKILVKRWLGVLDFILAPFVWLSASLLKLLRMAGLQRLPVSKSILFKVGIFPIRDHYYEPLFNPAHLRKSLRADRDLPGIDFNIKEQLSLLDKFQYNEELEQFPLDKVGD